MFLITIYPNAIAIAVANVSVDIFSYVVPTVTASIFEFSVLYRNAPVVAAGTVAVAEEAGFCAVVPFGSTNCPVSSILNEALTSQ